MAYQPIELVTPAQAEKYLATMVKNRPISQAKELEYAIKMEQGEWRVNGESIKFDQHGRLFDGQHRLKACILAGKPFRTYVARGIEDEHAFATVDIGKNRSHADIFGISGFNNPKDAAAAASIIYLFEKRMVSWRGPVEQQRHKRATSEVAKKLRVMPHVASVVPKEDLVEFARPIAEGLSSAVRAAHTFKARKLVSTPIIAALYYLFRDKSFDDAERFFFDLGEGAGLAADDPVYRLRERLIDERGSDTKTNRWTIIGLMLKVWNKRRQGEKLRYLKVQEGEDFPSKVL